MHWHFAFCSLFSSHKCPYIKVQAIFPLWFIIMDFNISFHNQLVDSSSYSFSLTFRCNCDCLCVRVGNYPSCIPECIVNSFFHVRFAPCLRNMGRLSRLFDLRTIEPTNHMVKYYQDDQDHFDFCILAHVFAPLPDGRSVIIFTSQNVVSLNMQL